MKTACVTGADRGVGKALAEQLVGRGYTVFAGILKEESASSYEGNDGGRLHLIPMDVSSDESVREAKRQIEARTDRLDLLINNAAILGDIEKTIWDELDFDEMIRVFNVNALGPLRVTQALIGLLAQGDEKQIINVSSEAGSIGSCYRTSWYAYCMSKAALNMESHLLFNEWKKHNGRVLVVHPGWVQTHMRGVLDAAAALTPDQSAEGILALMDRQKDAGVEELLYLDPDGERLPW